MFEAEPKTLRVRNLPRCAECRLAISDWGIPMTTVNRGKRRERFAHVECVERVRETMDVPKVGASVVFFVREEDAPRAKLPTERAAEGAMIVAIELLSQQRGYPPTMRELQTHLGLSSTSVVAYRLRRMRTGGLVEFENGSARTLRVTEAGRARVDLEHEGREKEQG